MINYAYVSNPPTGKTEFQIHDPNCRHLAALRRQSPFVNISEQPADSPAELVVREVLVYQDQGQEYNASDFTVYDCALHLHGQTPKEFEQELKDRFAEAMDEYNPENWTLETLMGSAADF